MIRCGPDSRIRLGRDREQGTVRMLIPPASARSTAAVILPAHRLRLTWL